jgi:hypothetical protein
MNAATIKPINYAYYVNVSRVRFLTALHALTVNETITDCPVEDGETGLFFQFYNADGLCLLASELKHPDKYPIYYMHQSLV